MMSRRALAWGLGLVGLVVLLPAIGWVQGTVMKKVRPKSYERLTESLS